MRAGALLLLGMIAAAGAGCAALDHVMCTPNCRTQVRNSSSLVSYLYPEGALPPAQDSVPELHVPLRVGLAFLPSRGGSGVAQLDEAHKEMLLERIRERFASRKFVSEIVIIPDYYLESSRGFEGLAGVQRLYSVDLMALVSYDQVIHTSDTKASLTYWTILGAYFIPGSVNDTTTLVDLAVVDPPTRSLVLRAGGTDTNQHSTTLIDMSRETRHDSSASFDAATNKMIDHFDTALLAFEQQVHEGKARVHVVARDGAHGGGAGAWSPGELAGGIVLVVLVRLCRRGTPGRGNHTGVSA